MKQEHVLKGFRMIEPARIWKDMKVSDIIRLYQGMGFNARRLGEAAELLLKMIDEDVTVCLTVSGAMTPVGMGGIISTAIEMGFVDWIVSTGANIYHDLHRPFGYPMVQGDFRADDEELSRHNIARIYDVFIHEDDTLSATDKMIIKMFRDAPLNGKYSTADLYNRLGHGVLKCAPHPEKSFIATAAKYDVPVYVPAQADSSVGMNLIQNYVMYTPVAPSPTLDILESAAIVRFSEKNGGIELGGGVPKNFFMQTQPTLWQIIKDDRGGHDYFIQITDARPDTGGLSGATPQEAKSWGKVRHADVNNVVVYSDSTIAFPLLMAYLISERGPRKHKRLYTRKDEYTEKLIEIFRKKGVECIE